jgi:hypothetical protein
LAANIPKVPSQSFRYAGTLIYVSKYHQGCCLE